MTSQTSLFLDLLQLGCYRAEARRLLGLLLMSKHPSVSRSLAAVAASYWKGRIIQIP